MKIAFHLLLLLVTAAAEKKIICQVTSTNNNINQKEMLIAHLITGQQDNQVLMSAQGVMMDSPEEGQQMNWNDENGIITQIKHLLFLRSSSSGLIQDTRPPLTRSTTTRVATGIVHDYYYHTNYSVNKPVSGDGSIRERKLRESTRWSISNSFSLKL